MLLSLINKRKQNQNLPRIRPEMTPVDWIMEVVAMGGLVFMFGYVIYWFGRLPEIIPSHFNMKGEVDGHGGRGFIFVLPTIGLFTYGLLTILSRAPHTFNFPGKVTPENAERQYRLALRLIRYIKLATVWLFLFITWHIVNSALKASLTMAPWSIPIFLAMFFVPIIIYLILAAKR